MKKSYLKPLVIGYMTVYLICMLLLTYLLQEYYTSQFSDMKIQLLDAMRMDLSSSSLSAMDGAELNIELQKEMSYKMQYQLDQHYEKYVQYGAAVYGPSGKLFAKAANSDAILQDILESKKLMFSVDEYNDYYSGGPKEIPTVTAFTMNEDTAESAIESDMFTLQIFQDGHPWKAAFSSLEIIYVYGLILIIVCINKSYRVTEKVYAKQIAIEHKKTRATEAIASKFKKPLHEMQGDMEKLSTESDLEKGEALERIITKTEEMDGMIKELILIAKDV